MADKEEPGRRNSRMKVSQAQAAMKALLPQIESLAARFQEISKALEAPSGTDDYYFESRPARNHLRYRTANTAELAAHDLLEVVELARQGAERTHADLMAEWEEERKREQEREAERYRRLGGLGRWM